MIISSMESKDLFKTFYPCEKVIAMEEEAEEYWPPFFCRIVLIQPYGWVFEHELPVLRLITASQLDSNQ